VPAERAFAVFTGSYGTWWPREQRLEHRHLGRLAAGQALTTRACFGGGWNAMGRFAQVADTR
jgi:hypothetical protein